MTADLTKDAGWSEAVVGVEAVLHVASPVQPGHVENEEDIIVPAREGTLRVLRAASDAGVPRVVLTSAFHPVGLGHGRPDKIFTEDDWSPLHGPGMDAYGRSKVLSEKAAWQFVGQADITTELVTICPVAVMGPLIGDSISGANHLVQRILSGKMPGFPDIAIPIVDVRDVAAAHISAMVVPEAAGTRILVAAQERATPMREVGAILRQSLGDAADKVPKWNIPTAVVRLAALASPEMRGIVPDLGYIKRVSNTRSQNLLGITPRPTTEAITSAGRSMVDRGAYWLTNWTRTGAPSRGSHRQN